MFERKMEKNKNCPENLVLDCDMESDAILNITGNVTNTIPKIQPKSKECTNNDSIEEEVDSTNNSHSQTQNNYKYESFPKFEEDKSKNPKKSFHKTKSNFKFSFLSGLFLALITMHFAIYSASAKYLPNIPEIDSSTSKSPLFTKIIAETTMELHINKILSEKESSLKDLINMIPDKNQCKNEQNVKECHNEIFEAVVKINEAVKSWNQINEELEDICKIKPFENKGEQSKNKVQIGNIGHEKNRH